MKGGRKKEEGRKGKDEGKKGGRGRLRVLPE